MRIVRSTTGLQLLYKLISILLLIVSCPQESHETQHTSTNDTEPSHVDSLQGIKIQESHQVIETDVVVIGAGYAGLTVARVLSQSNFSVHVLEASNATGGRTKNFCLKSMKPDIESPYVVELGGQWIGNKTVQPHAWKLIVEELGFKVFNGSYTPPLRKYGTEMRHNSLLYSSNGIHNFTELINAFHELPIDVQQELANAWNMLNEMAATIDLDSPYSSSNAREWDSQTFTSWINATVKLEESRTALQILCTTMIAQSADVVSFLHILFYIRASNGMKNLVVNEQEFRIVGGTQAPTFKMAKDLGPGRVLLSTPVGRIIQFNISEGCSVGGGVTVEAVGGTVVVHARYAVVTGAPPSSGCGIHFTPPLPYEKRQLFQRMPMGNSVKVQAVYPTPFWRDMGFTGTILASVPPFGRHDKPLLSNCFDNTPYAGTPGVILCFVEGKTSVDMMRWSHEERKNVVGNWLARSFGPRAMNSMRLLLDYNWAHQPYIGGAYSSYFTPGGWTELGHVLRKPFGNVFWAGTEYALDGFGYINGAIQSGNFTAEQIVKSYEKCNGTF